MLPIEPNEAALPMDRTESCEQMDNTEFSDESESTLTSVAPGPRRGVHSCQPAHVPSRVPTPPSRRVFGPKA